MPPSSYGGGGSFERGLHEAVLDVLGWLLCMLWSPNVTLQS